LLKNLKKKVLLQKQKQVVKKQANCIKKNTRDKVDSITYTVQVTEANVFNNYIYSSGNINNYNIHYDYTTDK